MKKILSLTLVLVMLMSSLFVMSSCNKQEMLIGKQYNPQKAQTDVLVQLNAGSIDVGVMDSIMAGFYMSQDGEYSEKLMIVEGLTLATEQYGIAARKGSGFAKVISAALIELAKQDKITPIAEKYGIASELCIDKNATVEPLTESEKKDWEEIQAKGTFVVGYTVFKPIAYEENNALIGFDIDLAKAVAELIGLKVEFQKIEWAAKEALLEGGNIDCIWNGMTITEERKEAMAITIPYLNNKQVAVIRKADKDKYTSIESMKNAIMGAEAGSAGESCIIVIKEEE